MDGALESLPMVLRAVTGAGGVTMFFAGLANMFTADTYTIAMIGCFALFFGVTTILCEFSPLGLHALMKAAPFLGEYRGRGFFYAAGGMMTLGREMKSIGQLAGAIMLISGIGSVFLFYLGPNSPQALGYEEHTNNNGASPSPSAFDRHQAEGEFRSDFDDF